MVVIWLQQLYIFFLLTLLISSTYAEETYLSLKKSKVNVRYGPSFESDIKYVYKKTNLPVKQIDKKENFRRIIDFKKNNGWIHISQLKKSNSFNRPSTYSPRVNSLVIVN